MLSKLSKDELISVDTEFISEKSYIPKLEVVQLNIKGDCVAIDVQKLGNESLVELMKLIKSNPVIVHGCEQDVKLLLHYSGYVLENAIDTQVYLYSIGLRSELGKGKGQGKIK